MKKLFIVFACLGTISLAFAVSGGPDAVYRGEHAHGSLDQQWGPDDFGYLAKDSNEPDGPAVNWIDLSEIGTDVTGLTDDNFVGPFDIGWDFRFYWYDVDEFFVGSNGYIKFSTPGQLAQPIPQFPTGTNPNNIVAPYAADWFFGASDPSTCRYWTNNQDTLIVSWTDVTAWMQAGNEGNHNFQVILCGTDSSITFNYASQTGLVSNDNVSIGIENLTGQIGISCYFGTYPSADYAIQFDYPDEITFEVNDLAISGVQNPLSGGFFLSVGDMLSPWLSVRNTGNQLETTYEVFYFLEELNGTILAQTDTMPGPIDPAMTIELPFEELWQATEVETYRVVGNVDLVGDIFIGNNTVFAELHTIDPPGELFYDDGSMEREWGWAGGSGGMGMHFVPPFYPCEVVAARIFVNTGDPAGFNLQVLDDDGDAGAPGTILYEELILDPPGGSWESAVIPAGTVIITDGGFYVAWMQNAEGMGFGLDETASQGISRRAWEYAGGWAENRLAESAEVMARATIRVPGTANEPPEITDYSPEELDTVLFTTTVDFSVTAQDPDGDDLFYSWTYDGTEFSQAPTASHRFVQLGEHTVMCVVSDFEFSDSVSWTPYVRLPSAVDDNESLIPERFALSAYPNPFNPEATLSYDIPEAGHVELTIFNLLGEEIATLASGSVMPGSYRATWDGSAQPSGTYFAILRAEQATKIQKLLLLK